MDLVLLNRQGLEFVIVLDERSGALRRFCGIFGVRFGPLMPSGAVAVGQLCYRGYSLRIAFRPLLAGHRREQAQIVKCDGKVATPRLEIADCTMIVQYERRRLLALTTCLDCIDDLTCWGQVVRDLHSFSAISLAVDQCSDVWQYAGGLRQRECTETHGQVV